MHCLRPFNGPSSPQHNEVADRKTHSAPEENIRREVRVSWETSEGQERRSAVTQPRDPPAVPVLMGDYRGYCKRRGGVAGREAAAIRERALVFEPGVAKISVGWNLTGFQPAGDVLHDQADNLRVCDRLGRQQGSALRMLVMFDQAGQIKSDRCESDGQCRVPSAQ